MSKKYMPGKHFLQLPGPSNVPDRILRAMDYPTICLLYTSEAADE